MRLPAAAALFPAVLLPLRTGSSDPSFHQVDDRLLRATRTPDGPVLEEYRTQGADLLVTASGPGATWSAQRAAARIGAADDPAGFVPRHPAVSAAWQRFGHRRIGAAGWLWEPLLAAVIQQKVTGAEALGAWRRLLQSVGEPIEAADGTVLRVPPDPEVTASLSDAQWHRFGVGPQRRDTLRRCATVAESLQRIAGSGDSAALDRALRSVPGVGAWTSAEVRQRVLGDPDAVSVGDFHVAGMVGWALAGERDADDARMLDLLAPYAGHRFRVQQLLQWAHAGPPRRGPRLAPSPHRRW